MNLQRIFYNVFSNWATLIATILVAFFVTPIIINQLGNEAYGIWVIIVSITGYFTVLDFGVNSALVRYISKYHELNDKERINSVYSTSFTLFAIIALAVSVFTIIFGSFFKSIINAESYNRLYLFAVFAIVGIDLAIKLLFSVLMGTLKGFQRFFELNVISICLLVIKNSILVIMLAYGYHLITLAMIQLTISLLMFGLQYFLLRRNYQYVHFSKRLVNKETLRMLYNYSVYSFMISIAIKVLFFTDSLVIGTIMDVSQVTFYAIPAMIMEYMEKIVWAVIGVLIPIISAASARGEEDQNQRLYQVGTRYTFLLVAPIAIVLYTIGDDFIALWIGPEFRVESGNILLILLTGYLFFLPQLIAHGILKGISRHKYLAYFLSVEALINLALSIYLGKSYGLKGVAIGTAVPLIVFNMILLPWYTCRLLGINYVRYAIYSILGPLVYVVFLVAVLYLLDYTAETYFSVACYSAGVTLLFVPFAWYLMLEHDHKRAISEKVKGMFKIGSKGL